MQLSSGSVSTRLRNLYCKSWNKSPRLTSSKSGTMAALRHQAQPSYPKSNRRPASSKWGPGIHMVPRDQRPTVACPGGVRCVSRRPGWRYHGDNRRSVVAISKQDRQAALRLQSLQKRLLRSRRWVPGVPPERSHPVPIFNDPPALRSMISPRRNSFVKPERSRTRRPRWCGPAFSGLAGQGIWGLVH